MSLGLAKSAVADDCHFVTDPVLPVSVNVVEFVPVQTLVPPVTVPPTVAGSTKIPTALENAAAADPFVTFAL